MANYRVFLNFQIDYYISNKLDLSIWILNLRTEKLWFGWSFGGPSPILWCRFIFFSCLFWAYFSLWILIKMVTHMHSDRAFIVIFFNKPGDFLRHFSLAATTQSRLLYKPKYHTQIYPLQFTCIISRMLGYDACLSYTKFYFYAVFLPTGFSIDIFNFWEIGAYWNCM